MNKLSVSIFVLTTLLLLLIVPSVWAWEIERPGDDIRIMERVGNSNIQWFSKP